MLEFKKSVLQGVSFDKHLFVKELLKASEWLIPSEWEELKAWCYETFSHLYKEEMDNCFESALVE